jgi:hypothetical protein
MPRSGILPITHPTLVKLALSRRLCCGSGNVTRLQTLKCCMMGTGKHSQGVAQKTRAHEYARQTI